MTIWWERFEVTREHREWTPGRVAAAERAVKREADAMPLFPELRRATTVEQRMEWSDTREQTFTSRLRHQRAKSWRRVRRHLFSLSPEHRAIVLAKWNTRFMPGAPQNLDCVMRMVLPKEFHPPSPFSAAFVQTAGRRAAT